MNLTVCLSTDTIGYPEGGGHRWVSLNWALGLRSLGCRVIWLESVSGCAPEDRLVANLGVLRDHLRPYGLAADLALCSISAEPLPAALTDSYLTLEEATEADLLVNLRYALPHQVVARFRRSALIDIDPGLLQWWISAGQIRLAPHDSYFTTGETVGRPGTAIPDVGLVWHHAPPCVALEWWPVSTTPDGAPFTTVSHWYADEWFVGADGDFRNDKRSGFLPFLDLPQRTTVPLELALCLAAEEGEERSCLERRGWRVRDAFAATSTPWDYQQYVRTSRGEFSCAKPSCSYLQNAWISDRTLCYLASGKPAVVQHTGQSRFLPDDAGIWRFRDVEEAGRCLDAVVADYERQCRFARALAEECFDAAKVVASVLERALL